MFKDAKEVVLFNEAPFSCTEVGIQCGHLFGKLVLVLHVVVTRIAKSSHKLSGCRDLEDQGRVLLRDRGSQDERGSRLVLVQEN
jgi:hypothetical protein